MTNALPYRPTMPMLQYAEGRNGGHFQLFKEKKMVVSIYVIVIWVVFTMA